MRRKEFMLNMVKAMPLVIASPSVLFADPVRKSTVQAQLLVLGEASSMRNLSYGVMPEYVEDWQSIQPNNAEFHLQSGDGKHLKTSKMIFSGEYDFDIANNRVCLESAFGEKTFINLGKNQEGGETRVFVHKRQHFGNEEAKRFFSVSGRTLLILD